ncbi:helix-turn-helix transcriptional regulator [Paucibacter sp. R3-3]|uniref:Helix-turn-helix transcriptional regulator n=1 Tax=Roseateles agri TaxID=3098619 RepID=A0ABU5DQL2_9BURK|nr:helix-turn-helix transcriptional regulator [Paucibacter sp. R3-3]MDY0747991.1 helix-turn-helix transcriptional regulator [Paucibacter sp. R3-3]
MLSFNEAAGGHSRSDHLLSTLPQPLLAALPDRRIVFANSSAERMFYEGHASCTASRLMSFGQLKAGQLEGLLNQASCGHSTHTGLWFAPGQRTGWLDISIASPSLSHGAAWPTGCLLLLVHMDEPALSQRARIDALCQQCRLTTTERYVLLLLADGLAVEQAAEHLGLKISTLRSHVRNLLGKTRAPSLMQLVRWIGSAEYMQQ